MLDLLLSAALVTPLPAPAAALAPFETARLDTAALYAEHCATCHGSNGDGKGTADLDRPARSFLDGGYSYGNTRKAVLRSVTYGIPGTPMPAFAETLGEEERTALADFVIAMGPKGTVVEPGASQIAVEDVPRVVHGMMPAIPGGPRASRAASSSASPTAPPCATPRRAGPSTRCTSVSSSTAATGAAVAARLSSPWARSPGSAEGLRERRPVHGRGREAARPLDPRRPRHRSGRAPRLHPDGRRRPARRRRPGVPRVRRGERHPGRHAHDRERGPRRRAGRLPRRRRRPHRHPRGERRGRLGGAPRRRRRARPRLRSSAGRARPHSTPPSGPTPSRTRSSPA